MKIDARGGVDLAPKEKKGVASVRAEFQTFRGLINGCSCEGAWLHPKRGRSLRNFED